MKKLFLVAAILTSTTSFATVYECKNTETKEGEQKLSMTYKEYTADVLTLRLLKNIKIVTGGETQFSRSYTFGKILKGSPITLDGQVEVDTFVNGATIKYRGIEHELSCSPRKSTINCLGDLEDGFELNICQNVENPFNGTTIDCTAELEDGVELSLCSEVSISN